MSPNARVRRRDQRRAFAADDARRAADDVRRAPAGAFALIMRCARPGCSYAAPCPVCAALTAAATGDALRVILSRSFVLTPAGAPCDPS